MSESRNAERGTPKSPAKRRGWRGDEFARHEVYPQILRFGSLAIIILLVVVMSILSSCGEKSRVEVIHTSKDLPSAWFAVPSPSSELGKHVN